MYMIVESFALSSVFKIMIFYCYLHTSPPVFHGGPGVPTRGPDHIGHTEQAA